MPTLTQAFTRESKAVHHEHYVLTEELHNLAIALEHVTADLDNPTSLLALKQIQMFGDQLADELPTHFRHEEQSLLSTVAQISPELDLFARQMTQQHEMLQRQLERLNDAVEETTHTIDMDATIDKVRAEGRAFVEDLKQHITMEEQELGGFL
jgi:hemerythrin-like domain-containing protein